MVKNLLGILGIAGVGAAMVFLVHGDYLYTGFGLCFGFVALRVRSIYFSK